MSSLAFEIIIGCCAVSTVIILGLQCLIITTAVSGNEKEKPIPDGMYV